MCVHSVNHLPNNSSIKLSRISNFMKRDLYFAPLCLQFLCVCVHTCMHMHVIRNCLHSYSHFIYIKRKILAFVFMYILCEKHSNAVLNIVLFAFIYIAVPMQTKRRNFDLNHLFISLPTIRKFFEGKRRRNFP